MVRFILQQIKITGNKCFGKWFAKNVVEETIDLDGLAEHMGNLNVIFSFCREINGEKKNFCLVTNPRKKLKYRMFTEAES